MHQTLLALFGIVMASVLTLHQSQSSARTSRQAEAADVQAVATEVAMARMSALERLAYDQAVVGDHAASPAELTPLVGSRYLYPGPDPAGDDLDDVHGEVVQSDHEVRVASDGSVPGTLVLETGVSVAYVSEADGETVSAAPTRFKRVTVRVAPVDAGIGRPVELTQLFSCGSYCAW